MKKALMMYCILFLMMHKLKAILNYAVERNAEGINVKLNMPENEVIDIDTTNADHVQIAIVQSGLDGFYLQGNGCTFNLQYEGLQYRGFLYFANGGDVHLQNFTIDYDVSNAVTGVIQSYDEENVAVTIAVDPEFNEFIERLQVDEGVVWNYLEYTKANKIPKQGGSYFAGSTSFEGYSITGNASEGYFLTMNAVGDYANVSFSCYDYNALSFANCKNVYVESVTMHSAQGMGIVGNNNENMYINGFRLCLKEGSNRLMTANADGVHILQTGGNVQITNSLFEYSHDDALNLKAGYWYQLSGYDVLKKQITIAKKTSEIPMPKAGDIIEIYKSGSFEKEAELTVASVDGNSLSYVITVEEPLVKLNVEEWTDCVVTNTSSAKLLYKNNIVRNKRNRGILVMAQDPEISNNTIQNVAHGAILVWGVMDNFNEATVPSNITIKNNKLINNNYEMSPKGDIYITAVGDEVGPSGTITDVVIENNFITKNGDAAVYLGAVENGTVRNNLFYQTTRVYRDIAAVVYLVNSNDIVIEGNYCYNSEVDALTGIYSEGTTDINAITLAENTELEIGYGEVGETVTVNVPHLNGASIVLDGDLSDWTIGADIDLLGATREDETRAEESEYSDHFKVNMAKIAYNDEGIYFAFDIYDDELLFKKETNFWYGDCVELLITAVDSMPNAEMSLYKNENDTIQLVCVPEWENGFAVISDRTSDDIYEQRDKFQGKVIETEEGYCGEVFIPFAVAKGMKEAIDNGTALTFNCVFADGARSGRQRIQIGNVPHVVEQNKKKTSNSIRYIFLEKE